MTSSGMFCSIYYILKNLQQERTKLGKHDRNNILLHIHIQNRIY